MARGGETPDGSPAGDGGSASGLPAPPSGAAGTGPARITVTIWHNVAFDGQGRHTAMLDGYQPGDPVVRVFAYEADPGRPAEEIADEAFAIFTGHPRDAVGADLACAYDGRRLRPLAAGDVVAAGDVLLAVGLRRLGAGHRPADRGPHPRARHPPPAGPQLAPGRQHAGRPGPRDFSLRGAGHMSGLMVTIAAGRRQSKTRTTGDAHLYRVVQYYDSWPFEPDSRVRTEARAAGGRRPSGRWSRSGSGWRVPTATRGTSAGTAGTGRPSWPWPSS